MHSLDLAANNIANASTTAYRSQRSRFQSLLPGVPARSALNRAVNAFGVVSSPLTDFSQGTLQKTGNPFDVGIEGSGFLAVQTKDGIRFTRDGEFHVGADRVLLTRNGDAVLGTQGPMRVPEGIASISPEGVVSVNGALAGKLRLVEFAAGTDLVPIGNSYYQAPQAAAKSATGSLVRQGMLESSNVQPVSAAVSLIALQRHAESLQRAMSLFHNELNRIAAEDLPRI